MVKNFSRSIFFNRTLFLACGAVLLLGGCAIKPVNYGDVSGFMGMGFIAKKTVILAYDGEVKPMSEVGVLALDARLRVRGIRAENGEATNIRKFSKGGLGIINTPNDEQIHLLPGRYVLSFCFYIDNGNQGAVIYCRNNLDIPVDVHANDVLQFSWANEQRGQWSVLNQPATAEVRQRVAKDFSDVMAAAKE